MKICISTDKSPVMGFGEQWKLLSRIWGVPPVAEDYFLHYGFTRWPLLSVWHLKMFLLVFGPPLAHSIGQLL